ncbi:trypsin-like serine protease [Burkholderia sp. Ap-962]|nr:trypsin-like serine protease [Burkholderia sp. Ap-962]
MTMPWLKATEITNDAHYPMRDIMPGRLNKSCAADGVVAYQDTEETKTFHYFPVRIDAIQGETLRAYDVKYWGINKTPYFIDVGNRKYQSVVGGSVSGQAVADITSAQRANIIAEIKRVFQLKDKDEVNLVPLVLQDVAVQPIFAKNLVEMGGSSSVTFPERFQVGTQFGFNVASGNSLFSELVGAEGSIDRDNSPDIGVNFYGTAELRADKWVARIEADLAQVWSYTRDKVDANLKLGWTNIVGVQYDKIAQSLIKENIVKITYIEGGGGKEFGRALLESTKTLFEAINAQITAGEGLFKFEPNPKPQEPAPGKDSLGGELLPWSMNINMSFGRETFKQAIKFDQTITFEGNTLVALNGNMALALPCNAKTIKSFYDLQLKEFGCITAEKSDGLQTRIRKEVAAKDAKVKEYFKRVEDGTWTPATMAAMLDILNQTNLTESASAKVSSDGVVVLTRLSVDEAAAELDAMAQALQDRQTPPFTQVARTGKVGKVFPPDTRKRITNTKAVPWNAIGELVVTFPDGVTLSGTGTLLDKRHVVTAAHVLHDENHGKAVSARFYPARNGAVDPFGSYAMKRFFIDDEYLQNSAFPDYDYCLVVLEENVTHEFATFLLRNAGDTDLEKLQVQIAGYPDDKPIGTLWEDKGKLTEVKSRSLQYRISTKHGESGSAVANKGQESWDIVGIHCQSSDEANVACRVTDRVIDNVLRWRNIEQVPAEQADCGCKV